MAPQARRDKIRALQQRLQDEPLENLGTSEASGSIEELGVQSDPNIEQTQTRTAIKHAGKPQIQAIIVCSPQSEEGYNKDSSFIQVTPSRKESESGSDDESEKESSTAPQASPSAPDTLSNWWCFEGIWTIYIEGMQKNKQGRLAHSMFENPVL